jgi:hypothetical protein
MNELILPIILTVVASTGFWTFVTTVYNNKKRKKSTDREALVALLHDRLYFLMQTYIARGEISTEEYDNIMYLYRPYAAMGGNGTCEKLLNEINKLPIKGE